MEKVVMKQVYETPQAEAVRIVTESCIALSNFEENSVIEEI